MPSFNMLSFFALWLSLASHALATTRHFNLELTWKVGSPDGFEREMIFINNQYPGPALELTQGEWAEITVVNKLPFNTTIHYHGTCSCPFTAYTTYLTHIRH
jgi:FtsP/CotA-like multicopper oxidase with cupredoxin domain